ncbi:MAG: hypothetical protein IPK82_42640 [Polyangiaceae bacterium]|nr:hypothetical protein [Polyangiaceae bacterium]
MAEKTNSNGATIWREVKEAAPYWAGAIVLVGLFTVLAWALREPGARTCSAPPYPCVAAPSPQTFPWAIVGQLALVVYAYAKLVQKEQYSDVFLGLALWVGELIWEMSNGVMGHFCGAPWFGLEGVSAWRIYGGVNIEISLMFAMVPPTLLAILPKDRKLILGKISNRTAWSIGLGAFCVGVEMLLNRAGVLTWAWWYWRTPHVALILFAYCSPYVVFSWVQYHVKKTSTSALILTIIVATAVICHFALGDIIRITCP